MVIGGSEAKICLPLASVKAWASESEGMAGTMVSVSRLPLEEGRLALSLLTAPAFDSPGFVSFFFLLTDGSEKP